MLSSRGGLLTKALGKVMPSLVATAATASRGAAPGICAVRASFSAAATRDPDMAGETHFGFETVKAADKEKRVGEVFSRVANTYDLMNDVLSVGVHRIWKDQMVHKLSPRPGIQHLDVAGGTGDISFRIIEKLRQFPAARAVFSYPGSGSSSAASVVVCDINQDMLNVGEERARKLGYNVVPSRYAHITAADAAVPDAIIVGGEADAAPVAAAAAAAAAPAAGARGDAEICFQQGDAANLFRFPDNSFDSYTIAFGLRNVTETDKALREAHRVLKKGGRFMCLEFSSMDNVLMQKVYDEYSFKVMPALGEIVANDAASYKYLAESIRQFPSKDELAVRMRDAGFKNVGYESMTFGMVAIHSGYKL